QGLGGCAEMQVVEGERQPHSPAEASREAETAEHRVRLDPGGYRVAERAERERMPCRPRRRDVRRTSFAARGLEVATGSGGIALGEPCVGTAQPRQQEARVDRQRAVQE